MADELFQEPRGPTPLTPEERAELIPAHIAYRAELNAAEQENIARGQEWALGPRRGLLTEKFVMDLHGRMFGDVWRWAGKFRKSERNLGIAFYEIPVALRQLLEDARTWIEYNSYPPDEIAVRFHHRLVQIHPFPNGNGRHSRLMADLLVMALGFLVAYSGTGLLLLCFLPLAGLRHGKAALAALLVVAFALGLIATGIIDQSVFTSRASELDTRGTSGYARFISPFFLAARQFDTASLAQLLLGSGPGTIKYFANEWVNVWYTGGFAAEWIKIFYEYGMIGTFVFICFLISCLRRSKCPALVRAAILFAYVFLQGGMTITIPLCTLNGPSPRDRVDEASRRGRSLVAASGSG